MEYTSQRAKNTINHQLVANLNGLFVLGYGNPNCSSFHAQNQYAFIAQLAVQYCAPDASRVWCDVSFHQAVALGKVLA